MKVDIGFLYLNFFSVFFKLNSFLLEGALFSKILTLKLGVLKNCVGHKWVRDNIWVILEKLFCKKAVLYCTSVALIDMEHEESRV